MHDMALDAPGSADRESLLLRGTLDMCVLALLAARPTHAYGVVSRLQEHGFAQTGYGTVYPLVTRLRRQGLVDQDIRPSPGGPARNVLTVTPEGRRSLAEWIRQWQDSNGRITALLDERHPTRVSIEERSGS